MCTVSMIGDDFGRRLPQIAPSWPQWPAGQYPPAGPSREEFDALRKEVGELRKLLIAAKEYDEATGQPDCEQADKIALLRKIAELVGVDLSEVFPESGQAAEHQ